MHATAIAIAGRAALIRGPSGSGKSDLALRCLALPGTDPVPGPASLVSDDYVELTVAGGRLMVRAPQAIRGRLEVRGIGIVPVAAIEVAEAVLAVDLAGPLEEVTRLPDPVPCVAILGVSLPVLKLAPFEASSPLKLLIALASGFGR